MKNIYSHDILWTYGPNLDSIQRINRDIKILINRMDPINYRLHGFSPSILSIAGDRYVSASL